MAVRPPDGAATRVAAREAVVERRRPCPASRCLARAVRLDVNLDSESGRVVSPAVRSLLARAVVARAAVRKRMDTPVMRPILGTGDLAEARRNIGTSV